MLQIADLHRDVDSGAAALIGVRFHVLDVGVDASNTGAYGGQQTRPVFDFHREANGVARRQIARVPLHVDAALGIVEEIHHVGTGR